MGTWIKPSTSATWGNITGDIDNQTDLKDELDDKLSLRGGTMTGEIVCNNHLTQRAIVGNDADNRVIICGGTGTLDGSSLCLEGQNAGGGFSLSTYGDITLFGDTDGNLTWDGYPIAIQRNSMPTATSDLVGRVYQFIGATTTNYTQGHFYMCVNNSGTYEWKDISSGEFLPLTGGTMTGEIRCNTSSSRAIIGNTDNGAVDICGGTSSNTGASLSLSGQDASGDFFLNASKNSKYYTLRGNASNGKLTWREDTTENPIAIQCDTMPTASASVVNRAYQYIGDTTTDYTQGHFYLCVIDGTTYRWKDLGASSGGEYLSLDGGTMRGEIICDISSGVAIKNVSDSGSIKIQGGTDYDSSYLALHGKSGGNGFTLSAGGATLNGNNDGSLFWGGKNILQIIYNTIYPVDTLHIGFSAPVVPSGVSATWTVQTSYDGKALWVDSTQTAGTTLIGSLPNIEGQAGLQLYCNSDSIAVMPTNTSGALASGDIGSNSTFLGDYTKATAYAQSKLKIQASLSNSVYSASAGTNVVRPTSIVVKVWKRTA